MRAESKIFLALALPAYLPLDEKPGLQRAKTLFLNSGISIRKALGFLNNYALWQKARLLLRNLYCELCSIILPTSETWECGFGEPLVSGPIRVTSVRYNKN